MKKIILCLSLSVLSGYGCSKEIKSPSSMKVNQCSYDDEYFDYCEKKYLSFYKKTVETQEANFNKNYILTSVGGENNTYAGIVIIDKSTGVVDTMIFGYRKKNKNELFFNLDSDVFCINSEVNSKSLGVTKSGESCFKYNKKGFELLESKKDEYGFKVSLLPYNSKDHYSCYVDSDKEACSKVRLISSNYLGDHYDFISPSFGDSVVLPKTSEDKEIIVSLFEDGGGPQIIISIKNATGELKQKTVSINKNVLIDKGYIIHYWEGSREIKEKL